jgi:hypothetical protein
MLSVKHRYNFTFLPYLFNIFTVLFLAQKENILLSILLERGFRKPARRKVTLTKIFVAFLTTALVSGLVAQDRVPTSSH